MKQHDYPTVVQIESTSMCNGECIMCSHAYRDKNDGKHLGFEKRKLFEEVLPFAETVKIHGLGEPFLNPEIVEWLSFYKRYGVHLSTFTNMTVLDERILEAIGSAFTSLHISCDGCSKPVYEAIRRKLRFDTFIQNVKLLHSCFPDLILHMHTVAMRQNLAELERFADFAAELGFSSVHFSHLSIDPFLNNSSDSLLYSHLAGEKFLLAEKRGKALGVEVTFPRIYEPAQSCSAEGRGLAIDKKISFRTEVLPDEGISASGYHCQGMCDWLTDLAYIDLEGNVSLCCSKYYLTMGNLCRQSFRAIWNNEKYRRLRQLFSEGKVPNVCRGCRTLAEGAMRGVALTDFDNGFLEIQPIGALRKGIVL